MKQSLLRFAIACCVMGSLRAQELVVNGDFANGLANWTQASWAGGSVFGLNTNGPTDTSAASGNYASAGGGLFNVLQQNVTVTAGTAYRLTFLAGSQSGAASTFGLLSLRQEALSNYNSASFDYRPSAAAFGSYTVDFVAGASTVGLWLRNDAGGYAAYDNVSLTPIAGVAHALNYSAASGITEITSVLSGSGKVTVNAGVGGLTLKAANSYTGGTEVSGGTLYVTDSGTLGAAGGAVTVSGSGKLDLRNLQTRTGPISMDSQDARILSGTGTGSLINNGGALQLGGGQISLPVSGTGGLNITGGGQITSSNSYTGATTISATEGWYGTGTFYVANAHALGAASGNLSISGGTVSLQSNTITRSGDVTISGGRLHTGSLVKSDGVYNLQGGLIEIGLGGTAGLTKTGAGTAVLAGSNTFSGGTLIAAGALQFSDGGSVIGPITNNAALLFDRSDDTVVDNSISGTGTLTKNGPGTVTLGGSNAYSGNTMVNAGALRLGAPGSMRFVVGASGVNTTVSSVGSFVADGTFVFDLAGAATNSGASWQLVAGASKTFGPSFAVASFTESSAGIWSLATNGMIYQFSESTGALSVFYVAPYDSWAAGYGLDPATSGSQEVDHDGDSLSNLREYAMGSNPAVADTERFLVSRDGSNLVFSWLQRTDNSVVYTLLERADLVAGSWLPSAVTIEPATGPTPPQGYAWVRISVPPDGKKFFRVRATMPQRQSITFDALPTKTQGLPVTTFALAATTSSGLPVSYTSGDTNVATVSGNIVTIVGVGTTTITASQPGNASYGAASDVQQTLTVAPRTSLTVDAKVDFGAVGDGVADDTVALQSALDYLASNMVSDGGGCLVLPSGTYRITNRLNFIKSTGPAGMNQGITIRGAESEGPGASIIYSAGNAGALYFDVNDTEGHYYFFGVRVQDLQIQAGAANAGAAIEIKRMPAIDNIQSVVPFIKNVAITTDTGAKYFDYGVVGRKVLLPEFTDVRVTGTRGGMEAGIYLDLNYSFTVNNCRITDADKGIDAVRGGEGNDIMHTVISNVNTGVNMHVDPFDPVGPSSLGGALYGCDIAAWDTGVIIDHKGYFPINDNNFTSLGTSASYRHLTLAKVHHVIVTDNVFTGASNQTGVRVESPYCWENTIAYNDFGSLTNAVGVTAGANDTMILDNSPALAPVTNAGNRTYIRRNAPRPFKETATRTAAYGYQPGRVLVPWNQMVRGPVIKVTDYGANGLDTLDDTTAIQNAANALRAALNAGGQGTLYFPAGLYRLSTRVDLTQGGANWQAITIAGDGCHVTGIAVTGMQGVFKIDCTQQVPVFMHGFRIDPLTSNPSTAIEVTQQNGALNGNRSLHMQDVGLFTWDARYFSGGFKGIGTVRPFLQNVLMRSVGNDNNSAFGIQFTDGYGFDWQGGSIYGKQTSGIIGSLGGEVNIRGPRFAGGGLTSLTVDANGGSFSLNAAHIDSPVNLRVTDASDAVVINALTIAGPQNPGFEGATTLEFRDCSGVYLRDNILAAAYQTPRPSNVFIQLGTAPLTCNGFDLSGNMMLFDDEGSGTDLFPAGTGINVPAGNLNGVIYDNRFFGNSINDIVCDEPSTVISLLPAE